MAYPTQIELKIFFHYDQHTGIFKRIKRWEQGRAQIIDHEHIPIKPGINGYLQIAYEKRPYLVHRLIFIYMTGNLPEQVDHINGNRCDNRWCNLRPVIDKVNKMNMGKSRMNTSGYTGVTWHKSKRKWHASFHSEGKHIHVGYFDNVHEAGMAVKNARDDFGFHKNHGERESWEN